MLYIFGHEHEETCLILGSNMDAMPFSEESADARAIKHTIHFAIWEAIERGFLRFIVPLEYGVGLWAAESVLALKRSIPFLELETLEAWETECEGEFGEHEFDCLMERMDWVNRWSKGTFLLPDNAILPHTDLLEMLKPGALLLFSEAEDDAMMELSEIAQHEKMKGQWHTWKFHSPSPNVFPLVARKDGDGTSIR